MGKNSIFTQHVMFKHEGEMRTWYIVSSSSGKRHRYDVFSTDGDCTELTLRLANELLATCKKFVSETDAREYVTFVRKTCRQYAEDARIKRDMQLTIAMGK